LHAKLGGRSSGSQKLQSNAKGQVADCYLALWVELGMKQDLENEWATQELPSDGVT